MTRLITALDYAEPADALALVERLAPGLTRLKVGNELFTAAGPAFVETLQRRGFEVFLDLKYHDIPNTVASACARAAALGVWMVNVHAGGGRRMLEAARAAVPACGGATQAGPDGGPDGGLNGGLDGGLDGGSDGGSSGGSHHRAGASGAGTRLIAVTVLTSLAREDLAETGLDLAPDEQVERLARLARETALDGVVCSPREIGLIRALPPCRGANAPAAFLSVTPGIRPAATGRAAGEGAILSHGGAADDQRRTLTPREAILAGGDHLVVGRAVTRAHDPLAALEAISAEVNEALRARRRAVDDGTG